MTPRCQTCGGSGYQWIEGHSCDVGFKNGVQECIDGHDGADGVGRIPCHELIEVVAKQLYEELDPLHISWESRSEATLIWYKDTARHLLGGVLVHLKELS